MPERFKDAREKIFAKWPAKIVGALVVLGFAIGTIDAYLEAASAAN